MSAAPTLFDQLDSTEPEDEVRYEPVCRFFVPCIPIAQPRQRHRLIKSKAGAEWIQNYTPARHKVNSFKQEVQLAAKQIFGGPPLEGPLYLEATFVLPRPKHMTKNRSDNATVPHDHKPDLDNLVKAIKDCLTGICYHDDGQVARELLSKWVAAGGQKPGVMVLLCTMEM